MKNWLEKLFVYHKYLVSVVGQFKHRERERHMQSIDKIQNSFVLEVMIRKKNAIVYERKHFYLEERY